MMLPTHALVGLAVAAPVAVLAPDLAAPALAGGLVGGVVPDLDMYFGHRKTLHFPTGYAVATLPAAILAWVLATPLFVGVAFALLGATLHCRMDRYGGGLELRPWEATSERAVYDHARGRWRTPKRWIRYDGAPEDVLLSVCLGVPLLVVLNGVARWAVIGALTVGITYGLLRRRLASLVPVLMTFVPENLASRLPERYRT